MWTNPRRKVTFSIECGMIEINTCYAPNHSPIKIVDAVHHRVRESSEAVLQNGTLEVVEG